MIKIYPGALHGAVNAPPSKSFSIRAMVSDFLAGGGTDFYNLSRCEDCLAAETAIAELHCGKPIHCGESALTLHLITAVAALRSHNPFITASGTLRQRPFQSLIDGLEAFGVKCTLTQGGFPIKVKGTLRAGKAVLDGRAGSQAVSGLLMVLPLLNEDSQITLLNPVSLPYIDLTLNVMLRFGVYVNVKHDPHAMGLLFQIPGGQSYRPTFLNIPGDWSGAAAVMAAVAVSNAKHGGPGCVVKGLDSFHPANPDSMVIEALSSAGVCCTPLQEGWEIKVTGALKPFVFDLTHSPDLAPALMALAAHIPGISLFKGAGRLKGKESNRGEVLQQMLGKWGIRVELSGDEIKVYGGDVIGGGQEKSHNDHRIAMAVAIAAVGAKHPVTLYGASCVAKTYPRFWDDMATLGLRIEKIE